MTKSKKNHHLRGHNLTQEDKKLGRSHIYMLIGIIIIGGAMGIYFLNLQH